jgi:hypothetical protein
MRQQRLWLAPAWWRVSTKPATTSSPLTAFPRSQWKALQTINALERINEEFRRRTKTQASLPSQDAVSCCSSSWCAPGASRWGASSDGRTCPRLRQPRQRKRGTLRSETSWVTFGRRMKRSQVRWQSGFVQRLHGQPGSHGLADGDGQGQQTAVCAGERAEDGSNVVGGSSICPRRRELG